MRKRVQRWAPPGKNCGLCGIKSCKEFIRLVGKGEKDLAMCVFYDRNEKRRSSTQDHDELVPTLDVFGEPFDFVLTAFPGEISARKIVMPFRPDLVEKWKIKAGDILVGRPMSAGCPVQHVLQVIKANPVTGVLDTWCVGPQFSRDKKTHDVEAYVMLGFEGIAKVTNRAPEFGRRQRFLPGFCMMNATHTGVVNMILEKTFGTHVRLEGIVIL